MFEEIEAKATELAQRAFDLIAQGKLASAEKLSNQIYRLYPTTHNERMYVAIQAKILLARKKKKAAKKRILGHNYAAWGSPDLQLLLRLCNPLVDSKTRYYCMTLRGGIATFGFTVFTSEHECEMKILANSQEEALIYAKELCNFSVPEQVEMADVEVLSQTGDQTHRGVIFTTPFRLFARSIAA